MPEIKEQSKTIKGGKRPGAGRKPSTLKGVLKKLPSDTAELILHKINAAKKWEDLANSKDENIVFQTLRYLTDRAYGKPKQLMQHSGENGGPIAFTLTRIGTTVHHSA